MATNKARLCAYVRPEIHEVFKRLGELQGESTSAVVADLLEAIAPQLMRTVAWMQAAADAPRQVREQFRDTIAELEREMVGASASSIAQMDWIMEQVRGGGAASSAASADSSPRPRPPSTNRGVEQGKKDRTRGSKK